MVWRNIIFLFLSRENGNSVCYQKNFAFSFLYTTYTARYHLKMTRDSLTFKLIYFSFKCVDEPTIRNGITWKVSFNYVLLQIYFYSNVWFWWWYIMLFGKRSLSFICNPNKQILLEGKHFNRLYHFVPFTTFCSYVNLRYVTAFLGSS